jgi:MFS-type transporter involved in bile tolerance (Atg22 family)
MLKGIGIVAIIALVVLLVIFGPFFTIWALNTLFPILAIPYTFETWCAAILLGLFLKGNVSVSKK